MYFEVCYKRLETSRFIWPDRKTEVVALTSASLHALLDGDDITAIRRHPR
ncbi:IS66 family insertion sequence element accessory protein TnpB, partial [Paraburkholderia unamae]